MIKIKLFLKDDICVNMFVKLFRNISYEKNKNLDEILFLR